MTPLTVSLGTDTKLNSIRTARVMRWPPRGSRGLSGSLSSGMMLALTPVMNPALTKPRVSSAFGEMPSGAKVASAVIFCGVTLRSEARATGCVMSWSRRTVGWTR